MDSTSEIYGKRGRAMNWQTIEKSCTICGAVFQRGKGISTGVWNARMCCCRNCSNYLRRKPLADLARQSPYYLNRRVETEKGVKTTYL
jgi:ribosome-binding protein aMBF1 (putative translation factor)